MLHSFILKAYLPLTAACRGNHLCVYGLPAMPSSPNPNILDIEKVLSVKITKIKKNNKFGTIQFLSIALVIHCGVHLNYFFNKHIF